MRVEIINVFDEKKKRIVRVLIVMNLERRNILRTVTRGVWKAKKNVSRLIR